MSSGISSHGAQEIQIGRRNRTRAQAGLAALLVVVVFSLAGCGTEDENQTREGNRAAGIEYAGPAANENCELLSEWEADLPELKKIGGPRLETALAQIETGLYGGRALALRAAEIATDFPDTIVNIDDKTMRAGTYVRQLEKQLRFCSGIAEVVTDTIQGR